MQLHRPILASKNLMILNQRKDNGVKKVMRLGLADNLKENDGRRMTNSL